MDHWYFAYGSNLLCSQMVERTGHIAAGEDAPRIVSLTNHRLVFNMRGGDGQLYANIVMPGEGVLGVVYRCTRQALAKLDGFEQGYDRRALVVIDDDGAELTAIAFVARAECIAPAGPPSAAYLKKILTGAREHGLPEEYIASIEATARG